MITWKDFSNIRLFRSLQLKNSASINIESVSGSTLSQLTASILRGLVPSNQVGINAGSALTLTADTHGNRTINLDTLAGSTVTLPASTGSGLTYRFRVSVLATSNSHIIKVANASDAFDGYIFSRDDTSDNAVAFFATAGTSDTITLNRSTTGSVVVGEWIEVQDIAVNRFHVRGFIANTGTPATPFSATV